MSRKAPQPVNPNIIKPPPPPVPPECKKRKQEYNDLLDACDFAMRAIFRLLHPTVEKLISLEEIHDRLAAAIAQAEATGE